MSDYAEKLPELTKNQLLLVIKQQGITAVLEQIGVLCSQREIQATIIRHQHPQAPKASEWRNLGASVLNISKTSRELEKYKMNN